MTEKYAEFDNVDKAKILPDIQIKSYTFKVTEVALALVALVAVVTCVALAALVATKGTKDDSNAMGSTSAQTGGNALCLTETCLKSAAFVVAARNESVQPCDNFYKYACGRFSKVSPLDPETSSRTIISNMYYENEVKLKNIIESPIVRSQDYSAERKIKHFFQSCTDTYRKERAKGSPIINKIFPNIGGWYVLGNWQGENWDFQQAFRKVSIDYWTAAFYTFRVATDWNDYTRRVIELDFAGMSMFWYYYLSPSTDKYRDDLKKYMRNTAEYLIRDSNITMDNTTMTERIETFISDAFTIETNLANITGRTMPTPDPHAHEKRVAISDLTTRLGTEIDFSAHILYMFDNANVGPSTKVVLREADWLQQMNDMIADLGTNKTRMLNNYLVWRMMDRYDQDLSWEYVHANREFYVDRYGTPAFLGTWLYCFRRADAYLHDALGSLFVRDHFADENKNTVHEILDVVKESIADSVMTNTFFDSQTKEAAKHKMKMSLDKLGYPDFMLNNDAMDTLYSTLTIDASDYFQNVLHINAYIKQSWNKLLKNHVQKVQEWVYKVYATYLEYYNPWNELIVPAGILQFPIYDHALPKFVNFGSMGSLLAHYLIHGIDHFGGFYDANGNREDWWTNHTTQEWMKTKKCVETYYSNKTMGPYTIPGQAIPQTVPVNGQYYASEAMAETSGVQIAFKAYQKWSRQNGGEKMAPGLGLSNEQMFFISYAQLNCFNRNDNVAYNNAIRGIVSEDLKVNSVLAQITEFSQAFNCPAKSPMNAEKKCNMYA
ncbi:hypothetical protein FSP39_016327 [Pinctada imbricata]|uniref:Endothelin-converting enzyme 1 n=1 Tax=Pinctada imbricata TaxID=66713 RepID=A0AA89C7T5_PINIB|nr:hypothetical protein FSP39_016327 [Pinctada imbricata]